MARYTGPSCRLCRQVQEKLFLKGERCFAPKCAIERRGSLPGMRPQRRRRLSDRGLQLREKQKARYTYGLLEQPFHRLFTKASQMPGVTGEVFLQLLERRLDNVIYRLGFAASRKEARQLVRHGHFLVNGRKVDIPSFLVKPGDGVAWHPGEQDTLPYQAAQQRALSSIPSWLSLDRERMEGRVLTLPERADVDARLNEKAIVEYYAR